MNSKTRWKNTLTAALILWSILFNSLPVNAQPSGDLVPSDDLSGGSSVFVFRQSRKAPQAKFASRNLAKKTTAQKTNARKIVKEQVAKVIPQREKFVKKTETKIPSGKPTPPNTKPTPDNTKVASKAETSNAFGVTAEEFFDRNDYSNAALWFKKAIELDNTNQKAKLGLSEALTKQADEVFDKQGAEPSVIFYQQAVGYNPKNSAAFASLGNAYEVLNENDLAFENYEKALAINPEITELYASIGSIYYQKGNFAKADEYLTKAAARGAEDEQTQYYLGLIRYKQNRNEEAKVAFEKTIALNNTAEAHYYLGEVLDRLDKDKDALVQYSKAVEINPNFTDAWFDLGAANYNRGRLEEAAVAYNEAAKLKNNDPEIRENLGDVYRQLKKYAEAVNQYRLATIFIESNRPKDKDNQSVADLYSKYAFVLGRTKKWADTVTALNKTISLNPDSFDYANLGWAYYNYAQYDLTNKNEATAKEKFVKAKEALQKSVSLNSQNPGTYMNLGLTLTDLGDYQNAVEAYKKCVQLKEKWVPAYNELGYAYRMMNDYENAIKNFKKAEELDNAYYPAVYNLAESEFRRGNLKEARKVQDRLRKLNPNMANQLELLFRGAVVRTTSSNIENKVNEKNPLNKIPKISKLPY